MRVVVAAGTMVDLAAWMAALDLDGGVPDRETIAKSCFETAHNVLGVTQRAFADHDVTAESHLV